MKSKKPGLAQVDPEMVAALKWSNDYDKYQKLVDQLKVVEHKIGKPGRGPAYLTDENVTRQNVDLPDNHPDFWQKMHQHAADEAGQRADELGHDINKLMGRKIY